MSEGSRELRPHSQSRFHSTRQAHADETAEDYVEAIEEIIARDGRCRVRDLASMMGVSHVTVTRIVSRLAKPEIGLVHTEPYQPIRLTAKGKRLAARVRRRHEIVVRFLHAIGVPARQAEIDAEGIEHHVSPATVRAMERITQRLEGDGDRAT